MNKKLTGKKILSSLLVLVLTLATVIGTNQLVKAEEEGDPHEPYDFILEITDGWDRNITVEYQVNSGDYMELVQLIPDADNYGFYFFNIENENPYFQPESANTLKIRITASENKDFWRAQTFTWKTWNEGGSEGADDTDILPDNVTTDSTSQKRVLNYSFEVPISPATSDDATDTYHVFSFGLCYPNSGRPEIVNEASKYIYAYDKTKDFNNSGVTDKDDLKYALASELYDRFFAVKMFGDFGIKANDSSEFINQLKNRITISDTSGSVTAITSSGTTSIDTYIATVKWGLNEENGDELISNLTVYALPDDQSLLICTDFNDTTGSGSRYYLRNTTSRNTTADDIVGFTQTNDSNPSDCGIIVTEDNLNVNTVVIGGHGAVTDIIDSTANYITMQVGTRNDRQPLGAVTSCQVRVLNPSKNFVAIHARGETEAVDGLTPNGFHPDTIYEAGSNSDKLTARIFIGDTTVNIGSLCPNTTGLSDDSIKITNVELANSKMKDGVTITKNTNSDDDWWTNSWDVSFKSNFYDSVPLKLTYNDSSAKYITLQRIGLVVRYKYLEDPGIEQGYVEDSNGKIEYDCYDRNGPTFTYNYFNGDQIMIYATYYHPSNDLTGGNTDLNLIVKYGNGEKKVISSSDIAHKFNGYHSATNGAVATTTFLIDFIPAKEKDQYGNWSTPITSINHKGGLHALVVNGGFKDKNSFGGAQIGNGLGVYWDGNITWDF